MRVKATSSAAVIPAKAGIPSAALSSRHSGESGNPASFARYSKHKDSGIPWIGDVPADWTIRPLIGIACECNEPNTGMRESNLLSLSYGSIVPKDMASNDGLLPESFETYQVVRPGDIVLRLTDLQNDKRSLRSAIVKELGIITSAYLAIRSKNIEPRFLAYLLRSYDLTKVFYSMGGGLRQSMKFAEMKRLPVLVPSGEEQIAIAGFLDRETAKIDALIAEQEKLVALLKEKRQALISHAVTKGLDPNAPMKDSGIEWLGQVPAQWEIRRLKTLSKFTTSGPRGWSERIADGGSLFIQSGDLNDALGIDFENAKRVEVGDDAEAKRTRLQSGDVVVCITGAKTGNGAVCLEVPEDAYVNQHLCLVRPNPEVVPLFLGTSLKSRLGQIQFELSQYGLKQGLSLENVREIFVTVPPIEEQHTIVARLDEEMRNFDTLQIEAERAIALLKERRAALISAAVTGKIDVRNA